MPDIHTIEEAWKRAAKARRWVVKIGTSVLTDAGKLQVSRHCVQAVAKEISVLWENGKEVILVTSGAIGIGMGVLELKSRPSELAKLQAAAAVGQGKLMQWYTSRMEEDRFHAAQVLLTRGDLEDRQRRLNVKATLETLLAARIIPIINENDTVSTEEIRYGDNDLLSAHVATLVGADLLLLLTDVDQVVGPGGPLDLVKEITPELEKAARGTEKPSSAGGMRSKLEAARIALSHGVLTAVMSGRGQEGSIGLAGLAAGTGTPQRGTWFIPSEKR